MSRIIPLLIIAIIAGVSIFYLFLISREGATLSIGLTTSTTTSTNSTTGFLGGHKPPKPRKTRTFSSHTTISTSQESEEAYTFRKTDLLIPKLVKYKFEVSGPGGEGSIEITIRNSNDSQYYKLADVLIEGSGGFLHYIAYLDESCNCRKAGAITPTEVITVPCSDIAHYFPFLEFQANLQLMKQQEEKVWITTPAGTFHCIVLGGSYGPYTVLLFGDPDIPVPIKMILQASSVEMVVTLIELEL